MPRKGKRSDAAKRRWNKNRLQLAGTATQCDADDAQHEQQATFGKDYIISLKTNKIITVSRLSKERRPKELKRAQRHMELQQLRACNESMKDTHFSATKAVHSPSSPACSDSSNRCLSVITDVYSLSAGPKRGRQPRSQLKSPVVPSAESESETNDVLLGSSGINAHFDDTMPVKNTGGEGFEGSPGMASNITQTVTSTVTEEDAE